MDKTLSCCIASAQVHKYFAGAQFRRIAGNAGGRILEDGEFSDVGATINAWLGGKPAGRGVPGTSFLAS